jgi:hypothetical protein
MVAGVGKVNLINGIDVVSRVRVESYLSVGTTNPPTEDYLLALRHAFVTCGLPQRISLDHGTDFLDNTIASPFLTRLHLWLLALGIEVQFIRPRRPTDHAIVERTHQTMARQAFRSTVPTRVGGGPARYRPGLPLPCRVPLVPTSQAEWSHQDRELPVLFGAPVNRSSGHGELAIIARMPTYQLALPLTVTALRHQSYIASLTGTN